MAVGGGGKGREEGNLFGPPTGFASIETSAAKPQRPARMIMERGVGVGWWRGGFALIPGLRHFTAVHPKVL